MSPYRRSISYIIVFITSMGIMIIELLASRIVSKYFGNSLFTWTAVIGIVLGGISLGNFLGGKLADRFEAKSVSSVLLLSASALTFLILVLDLILGLILKKPGTSPSITSGMILRSLIAIFFLFFLPSSALGTISPVMAKYALTHSERKIGKTVGSIYAVSAIGSIIGTFLSGYVLIPLLGVKTIVFAISMSEIFCRI